MQLYELFLLAVKHAQRNGGQELGVDAIIGFPADSRPSKHAIDGPFGHGIFDCCSVEGSGTLDRLLEHKKHGIVAQNDGVDLFPVFFSVTFGHPVQAKRLSTDWQWPCMIAAMLSLNVD
jgi:hypothetical protein